MLSESNTEKTFGYIRYPVLGLGHVGYTPFGVAVKDARELLKCHLYDEAVQDLLQAGLLDSLLKEKFVAYLVEENLIKKDEENTPEHILKKADRERLLSAFIDDNTMLYHFFSRPTPGSKAHLAILKALAYITKVELYIWELGDSEQLVTSRKNGSYDCCHYAPTNHENGREDLLLVGRSHFESVQFIGFNAYPTSEEKVYSLAIQRHVDAIHQSILYMNYGELERIFSELPGHENIAFPSLISFFIINHSHRFRKRIGEGYLGNTFYTKNKIFIEKGFNTNIQVYLHDLLMAQYPRESQSQDSEKKSVFLRGAVVDNDKEIEGAIKIFNFLVEGEYKKNKFSVFLKSIFQELSLKDKITQSPKFLLGLARVLFGKNCSLPGERLNQMLLALKAFEAFDKPIILKLLDRDNAHASHIKNLMLSWSIRTLRVDILKFLFDSGVSAQDPISNPEDTRSFSLIEYAIDCLFLYDGSEKRDEVSWGRKPVKNERKNKALILAQVNLFSFLIECDEDPDVAIKIFHFLIEAEFQKNSFSDRLNDFFEKLALLGDRASQPEFILDLVHVLFHNSVSEERSDYHRLFLESKAFRCFDALTVDTLLNGNNLHAAYIKNLMLSFSIQAWKSDILEFLLNSSVSIQDNVLDPGNKQSFLLIEYVVDCLFFERCSNREDAYNTIKNPINNDLKGEGLFSAQFALFSCAIRHDKDPNVAIKICRLLVEAEFKKNGFRCILADVFGKLLSFESKLHGPGFILELINDLFPKDPCLKPGNYNQWFLASKDFTGFKELTINELINGDNSDSRYIKNLMLSWSVQYWRRDSLQFLLNFSASIHDTIVYSADMKPSAGSYKRVGRELRAGKPVGYVQCALFDGDSDRKLFGMTLREAQDRLLENLVDIQELLEPFLRDSFHGSSFLKYLKEKNIINQAPVAPKNDSYGTYQYQESLFERYKNDLPVLSSLIDYLFLHKYSFDQLTVKIFPALAHIGGVDLNIWKLGRDSQLVPDETGLGNNLKNDKQVNCSRGRLDLLSMDYHGGSFCRLEFSGFDSYPPVGSVIYPLENQESPVPLLEYAVDCLFSGAGDMRYDGPDSGKNENQEDFFCFLVEQGVRLDFLSKHSNSLLHIATSRNWKRLVNLLLFSPYSMPVDLLAYEKTTPGGDAKPITCLAMALKNNNMELARFFINNGADVKKEGSDLLRWAYVFQSMEVLILLLSKGADPEQKLNKNSYSFDSSRQTLLEHVFSQKYLIDNQDELIICLMDHGAQVKKEMLACIFDSKVSDRLIIDKIFPRLTENDIFLETPLISSITHRRTGLSRFLIKQYPVRCLEERDHEGRSALHVSIVYEDKVSYDALLQLGCNAKEKDNQGLDAIDYAIVYGRVESFQMAPKEGFPLDVFLAIKKALESMKEFSQDTYAYHQALHSFYSYKLVSFFSNVETFLGYCNKFFDKYIKKDSSQPIHDLCLLFKLPINQQWNKVAWIRLIVAEETSLEEGLEILKYVFWAPNIELKLGRSPANLEEIIGVYKDINYIRSSENQGLASLFIKYKVSEQGFERVLNRFKKKNEDYIPEIFVDGDTVGEPGFYLKKLPKNDYRGFILGCETACCQRIEEAGEVCAWHGMSSPYGGFYVIFKKSAQTKARECLDVASKVAGYDDFLNSLPQASQQEEFRKRKERIRQALPKYKRNDDAIFDQLKKELEEEVSKISSEEGQDDVIAQSWVWRTTKDEIVFDSFERKTTSHNKLCYPFFEKASKILMGKYSITKVFLGASGNTPKPSNADIKAAEEEVGVPVDYAGYRDSQEQYLLGASSNGNILKNGPGSDGMLKSVFFEIKQNAFECVKKIKSIFNSCDGFVVLKKIQIIDKYQVIGLKELGLGLLNQGKVFIIPVVSDELFSVLIVDDSRIGVGAPVISYINPLGTPLADGIKEYVTKKYRGSFIRSSNIQITDEMEKSQDFIFEMLTNYRDTQKIELLPHSLSSFEGDRVGNFKVRLPMLC